MKCGTGGCLSSLPRPSPYRLMESGDPSSPIRERSSAVDAWIVEQGSRSRATGRGRYLASRFPAEGTASSSRLRIACSLSDGVIPRIMSQDGCSWSLANAPRGTDRIATPSSLLLAFLNLIRLCQFIVFSASNLSTRLIASLYQDFFRNQDGQNQYRRMNLVSACVG